MAKVEIEENADDVLDTSKQEKDNEEQIRPQMLAQYIGQQNIKDTLAVYIKAATSRNESLDHVLVYGPPGLGKTTLSQIIANELGVNIKITSGPAISKSGDLAAILTSLGPGDVLFIDEIHRLSRVVEEVLYSAMEDYVIDIVIGREDETRAIRIDLQPFTLIGATTRFGDISSPLRGRFGVTFKLEYYDVEELGLIIKRTAGVYDTFIDEKSIELLAKSSRGTPRVANRLFRRVRDFADVLYEGKITSEVTEAVLKRLGIVENGLDVSDLNYLNELITVFKGGPVGLTSISATLGEEPTTVADVHENFLIQEGYIMRTPKGRIATEKSYELLGLEKPAKRGRQEIIKNFMLKGHDNEDF